MTDKEVLELKEGEIVTLEETGDLMNTNDVCWAEREALGLNIVVKEEDITAKGKEEASRTIKEEDHVTFGEEEGIEAVTVEEEEGIEAVTVEEEEGIEAVTVEEEWVEDFRIKKEEEEDVIVKEEEEPSSVEEEAISIKEEEETEKDLINTSKYSFFCPADAHKK
ncbi:cilia- and flagella-associated protein 251-like [Oncorhynchus keta]|uniref:cilia- and flagella-associated protein 251-like n=1 Tax=Oncorhynchus keta TaxID=8018 RepID=UPI00227A6A90|nr:cilia- and flagella-associated protein 251-like [Oncorhynchus keta]